MTNKFFDIKTPVVEKKSEQYISKYLVSHYEKIKNLDNDLKRLPTDEEFFFIQSDTQFNAFTFIPLIGQYEKITELHASTYNISRKVVDALIQLNDQGIIEVVNLMISDSLLKRNPATIDYIKALTDARANFNITFTWVHAKVATVKTKTGYYVIEGSGNWAANAHYEQYLFANSKGLYNFRKTLFTEAKLR